MRETLSLELVHKKAKKILYIFHIFQKNLKKLWTRVWESVIIKPQYGTGSTHKIDEKQI